MTAVRRTGRWAVNVLVVLVMLGAALWLAPSLFGYSRYVITGGSMAGTYDKGSVVFEEPVPVDDLRVGDVITYLPPAGSGVPNLVTHRITKIQRAENGGRLLTTQGDANSDPDPWRFTLVGTEQPVARAGIPYAGWAFIALADRETRMLIVGGPAALIALLALRELAGAVRRRPEPAPAARSARATRPAARPAV